MLLQGEKPKHAYMRRTYHTHLDVPPAVRHHDGHAGLVDEVLGREHLAVLVVLGQGRQGVVLLPPHHQLLSYRRRAGGGRAGE